MFKKDIERAVKLAKAGARLCSSIIYGVFPKLLLFAEALVLLSVIAAILVALRIVLILLAPKISSSAKAVTITINVFLDIIVLFIDEIKLTIYGIELIIEVLSLGSYHPKPFKASSLLPPHISSNEVVKFANTAGQVCPKFNSASTIFGFLAPQALHSTVCPLLRAMKPISVLGPVTENTLSWAVSGGFEAYPDGDNCMMKEPMYPDATCVIIGVGIILAEVFIPLLLIGILISSSGGIIASLIVAFIENVMTVVDLAVVILTQIVLTFDLIPANDVSKPEKNQVAPKKMLPKLTF